MRLLNPNGVAAKLDSSLSTLNRLRKADPTFPPALRLTGPNGRPLWREDLIDAWLAGRGGVS
jgi:predicted DNA-binding transcriptional regulator AlpA